MARRLKKNFGIAHQVESFFTGTELQFEPDGAHFYAAYGSIINRVSTENGQVVKQITTKNEGDNVISFVLTSDCSLIVIAYSSGLITKYDLVDEKIDREFKSIHSAPISLLRINSSDTLLATASSDGTVKLWNLINHYCSHNLKGVNGVISCLEFYDSPDGDLLFCASGDDCIHVFEISTSKRILKLSIHCSTITDMKITFDRTQLISVGRDKIAVVWDISRHAPNNKFGTSVRTIPLFETIESLTIVPVKTLEKLIDVNLNDDRAIFATVGEEGLVKFWDARTGSMILSQTKPPLSNNRPPGHQCIQLCPRPGHNQLCAVTSERDVFVYNLPRLELVQQLQGHLDEILSACWFDEDKHIAVACNSSELKVMEVRTSKSQHLKGHTDIVLCVKAVPNNPLCILSSSKDCTILVWKFNPDTMTPSIIFKGTGHTHSVHALGICATELTFFSGSEDTTLKRWSFKLDGISSSSGQESQPEVASSQMISNQTVKAHDARVDAIAVSPNDQLVVTGSRDRTAKIFSAANLQIIATLKGHRRGVYAVQFSPVDQVVVTAADVCLRMWNLQDFTCVKTFQGHDCAVLNFSFFSAGLQIVSIGSDGNMKIWDCKTNECTKTIDAHEANTWTLSLTEDDSKIVTGGQDEKLIIWRDITEEEREEKLIAIQTQVAQEQDFLNYINKKKWRKALKMALTMENQSKALSVIREFLLEPNGIDELSEVLTATSLDKINFLIECCVTWSASAKNASTAQQVLNIIIRAFDNDQLLKLPNLKRSMDQLKILTEKSFNRYERMVQQATFVDFFTNSIRIQ